MLRRRPSRPMAERVSLYGIFTMSKQKVYLGREILYYGGQVALDPVRHLCRVKGCGMADHTGTDCFFFRILRTMRLVIKRINAMRSTITIRTI